MSDKCCKDKNYEPPKDANFYCEKCGRKSDKVKKICKPKKIKK